MSAVSVPPEYFVECESHAAATVFLDGGESSTVFPRTIDDSDWIDADCGAIATGVRPSVTLPLGTHEITLRIPDRCGSSDEDTVWIIVEDTQALPASLDERVGVKETRQRPDPMVNPGQR